MQLDSSRQAGNGRRIRLFQILLLLASIAVGLGAAEALYRGRLWLELGRQARHGSYSVFSEPLYRFDRDLGYTYVPGRQVSMCQITDGIPDRFRVVPVDSAGNIDEDTLAAGSRIKVLGFGDSFTANPRQQLSWTHYLSGLTGFRVQNFGRDGYGVLQTFHLAAVKARELKPDLIIVALIVDDLHRARSWRTTADMDGQNVMVVSERPEAVADLGEESELGFVDPAISPGWFNSLRSAGGPDNPVLDRARRSYERLQRRRLAQLLGVRHSFLLARIRHGDAFHGLYRPSRNPRTPLEDYSLDPQLVEDIRSIQVPLLVVLLPTAPELARDRYLLEPGEHALLASLERLLGQRVHPLMNYMDVPTGDVAGFFLPGDGHPSPLGSRAYAEGLARLIRLRVRIGESSS